MAQGTIQYFQPAEPILLHTDLFAEYYPLDFDGDGNADFTFGYDFHFIGVRSEGANRILIRLDPPPNIGGSIVPLAAGFSIGTGSSLDPLSWWAGFEGDFDPLAIYFNTGTSGDFVGQHAYMGVEFQSSGNTHYGWALLGISDFGAFGRIDAWAWETRAGESIFAGAVPEPSTWALLSAGGILFWLLGRRKHRA